MPSAVVVLAVAFKTKFSLSSKFSRNIKSMSKVVQACFIDFGECCGRTVLMSACYWPPSHCIPAQMFVSVSVQLNHKCSPGVLDSDRVHAVSVDS